MRITWILLWLILSGSIHSQDDVVDELITRSFRDVEKLYQELYEEIKEKELSILSPKKNKHHLENLEKVITKYFSLETEMDQVAKDSIKDEYNDLEIESLFSKIDELHRIKSYQEKYFAYKLIDKSGEIIDTSESVKRLRFFKIQKGDKIGEIGVGYGYTMYLLGQLNDKELKLFANELDTWKLKNIEKKLICNYPKRILDRYTFVEGSETSTSLEGSQLDLLIVENTLHHFIEKELMLKSVKKTLKVGGRLVLIEEYKKAGENRERCSLLMTSEELHTLMEVNGFKKLREEALNKSNKVMIEYQ